MDEWKTKIPLAQEEDTYLAIRTMKSDIETFKKTGEPVSEVIMRKDIESAIPSTISPSRKIFGIVLYILLGAAILFFLYSLYLAFS